MEATWIRRSATGASGDGRVRTVTGVSAPSALIGSAGRGGQTERRDEEAQAFGDPAPDSASQFSGVAALPASRRARMTAHEKKREAVPASADGEGEP